MNHGFISPIKYKESRRRKIFDSKYLSYNFVVTGVGEGSIRGPKCFMLVFPEKTHDPKKIEVFRIRNSVWKVIEFLLV